MFTFPLILPLVIDELFDRASKVCVGYLGMYPFQVKGCLCSAVGTFIARYPNMAGDPAEDNVFAVVQGYFTMIPWGEFWYNRTEEIVKYICSGAGHRVKLNIPKIQFIWSHFIVCRTWWEQTAFLPCSPRGIVPHMLEDKSCYTIEFCVRKTSTFKFIDHRKPETM